MSVPTIAGLSEGLGQVEKEQIVLESNLLVMPRPLGTTNNTFVANIFGKTRRIITSGYYEGTETELRTWIQAVEALVNVNVQNSRQYIDRYFITRIVLIDNFTFESDRDNPNRLNYSIEMLEGNLMAWYGGAT